MGKSRVTYAKKCICSHLITFTYLARKVALLEEGKNESRKQLEKIPTDLFCLSAAFEKKEKPRRSILDVNDQSKAFRSQVHTNFSSCYDLHLLSINSRVSLGLNNAFEKCRKNKKSFELENFDNLKKEVAICTGRPKYGFSNSFANYSVKKVNF